MKRRLHDAEIIKEQKRDKQKICVQTKGKKVRKKNICPFYKDVGGQVYDIGTWNAICFFRLSCTFNRCEGLSISKPLSL